MSTIASWLVPPIVGVVASIALKGPLWNRIVFCLFIIPIAYGAFRIFLMTPPRDAGSDAFLLFYTFGFSIYSIFGLIIAWFGVQYFKRQKVEK